MKKIILKIEGMTCSACSLGLEKYLNKQKGIHKALVNLVLSEATIEYEDDLTIENLNKFIEEAGFKSLGVFNNISEEKKKDDKKILVFFGVLSVFILYIAMYNMLNLPLVPYININFPIIYSISLLIFAILYIFYGFDILKSGYKNFIHKTPNMDTLVSIGVLSSFFYSLYGIIMIIKGKNEYISNLYFDSVCIIIYFIKLGRYIDRKSKDKTKSSIKELVTITPSKAILKVNDKEETITLDEIKQGDILICKPGMKVAVDGTIISGSSHFDESFITGESIPIKKEKNSKVVAGSLNIDGYIEYKAEKIGKDSTISEIVRLVVEATNAKVPIAKLADKVSSIFVPSIIIIAFITFALYLLITKDINISLNHFVTVLVVACPCALGLATPLAIVVSEGLCAKNGILVKTGEVLELVGNINTIVLDKTGTLTRGNLQINKIYNYSGYSNEELLQKVASTENQSSHPIAGSFMRAIKKQKISLIKVKEFKNLSGLGVSAKIDDKIYYIGNNKIISKFKIKNKYSKVEEELANDANSIVYVIENKKIIALIGVKDIVRENVNETIKNLKKLNKEIIMLTGDNEKTASIIANSLKIDTVISNVMPKEKANKIEDLIRNNKKVMMVGDGINDAPSLARSSIGVSVYSGTDIANNSSDVILMNNNLMNLVNLIIISKKTIKIIKQNLFWAFFYNICMIPIATGLFSNLNIKMNPMIGALAMTISSLTVILNTLRLKKVNLK